MDTSFHYLLLAAQGMFQRRILARLAGSGLTAGQPKVLNYLGLHNGSVQKNIALGCQIDPATLTGLLGRMEEKGLVERRAEGGDRRALHVYLTDFGWEKQREVLTLCFMQGKSYQEVADGLGVSVNTVKTHIKRGLKFLRDELQDDALLLLLAFPRRRVMP